MEPAAKPSFTGLLWSVAICAVAAFVLTSLGEGLGTVSLPTFLEASMSMVPGPFRIHILACCFGTVAGSAAFTAARLGHTHRSIGRLALALLLLGSATSIPVALAGASSPFAKVAFIGQAVTLAASISVGWLAGLRGRIGLHRACIICAGLVLSGAPLSRLALKLPDPWLSPTAGYAAVAWFSWLMPFAAAACYRLATRRRRSNASGGASR